MTDPTPWRPLPTSWRPTPGAYLERRHQHTDARLAVSPAGLTLYYDGAEHVIDGRDAADLYVALQTYLSDLAMREQVDLIGDDEMRASAALLVDGLDPEHGHAWRILVEGVGSGAVVGERATFAQYVDTPWQLVVQGNSLRAALRLAAEIPLPRWRFPSLLDDASSPENAEEKRTYRAALVDLARRLPRIIADLGPAA